jgi:xylulokinase
LPDITVIGGSSRNEQLLRIKASVTNRPHHVLRIHEATALGGALLGGLAAGIYRNAADVKATITFDSTTIEPDPAAIDFYEDFYQNVYKQLYSTLKPLNHAIYDEVVDVSREPSST